MEHEINQIIDLIHNDKAIKLIIEETKTNDCTNCFFKTNKSNSCIRHLYNMADACCSPVTRSDKKNIIYRQIK